MQDKPSYKYTMEINTLKAILGKTRRDRVDNKTIRKKYHIIDIAGFIKNRR